MVKHCAPKGATVHRLGGGSINISLLKERSAPQNCCAVAIGLRVGPVATAHGSDTACETPCYITPSRGL